MIAKIKGFSKGKKIYSLLWLLWVILLGVLIGLFIGFKNEMNETVDPKIGWTINKDYKKVYTFIDSHENRNSDDLNWIYEPVEDEELDVEEEDYPNYYVMDIDKTFTKIKDENGISVDGANIIKIKNELKDIVKNQWNDKWDKWSVMDIIDEIRKFKTIENDRLIFNYKLIDAANMVLWTNAKYKKIDDVRHIAVVNYKYDINIAMGKKDGEEQYFLKPVYNHKYDKYEKANILTLDKWHKEHSKDAIFIKNIVAAVGFIWLISMVLAVITTVSVSIMDKRRKDKAW